MSKTTNKPEVVAWRWRKPIVNDQGETVGTTAWELGDAPGFLPWWTNDPLIRLSDYEALQAEYRTLESELATVKKVAYGNVDLLDECEKLRADNSELREKQPNPDVSALVDALKWLRGAINCTPENDKHRSGTWISTKHPRIRQIDELLAAYQKNAAGNQFRSDIAETEKERRLMRDVGALNDSLADLHTLNRLLSESLELFVSNPTPTSEDFDMANAALAAYRKQGGE